MRVVIQKVNQASVVIEGAVHSSIEEGYLLLVGFGQKDNKDIIDKMVDKILKLRIIEDNNGKMNDSILDHQLEILSVSQFTLYADVRKGRRPSFTDSRAADEATKLYDLFNQELSKHLPVKTGVFQADMQVNLVNDGPLTIIIDSEEMGW